MRSCNFGSVQFRPVPNKDRAKTQKVIYAAKIDNNLPQKLDINFLDPFIKQINFLDKVNTHFADIRKQK